MIGLEALIVGWFIGVAVGLVVFASRRERHWNRVEKELTRADTEMCLRCFGRGSYQVELYRDRLFNFHVTKCECCVGAGVVKRELALGGLR